MIIIIVAVVVVVDWIETANMRLETILVAHRMQNENILLNELFASCVGSFDKRIAEMNCEMTHKDTLVFILVSARNVWIVYKNAKQINAQKIMNFYWSIIALYLSCFL